MNESVKSRLVWLVTGFALGCFYTVAHASWNLWPFQDNLVLHWTRWVGKESIKWVATGIGVGIVVFLTAILLNSIWTYWNMNSRQH